MEWICDPPKIDDLIHPEEQRVVRAIQKSSFYSLVTQRCGDILSNITQIPKMVLTGYPITENTAPRIYRYYKKALKRLGSREVYPLFMDFSYELSGKVYGTDENGYILVISSQCGEILTDGELTAFLGGEIGQALAGHPQHHALLDNLQIITDRIPFAGEIVRNQTLGLFVNWIIASGYTVDRAALTACEDLDALISLRKKQMGFAEADTGAILTQKPDEIPEKPGMYYVLMAKDMPLIGGVSRIQEIYRWIQSEQFSKNFMPLLYKLCLCSKELTIPHDKVLLERHQKTASGDAHEMALLGEQYMFGKNGFSQSIMTGESLLRQASFEGNARAMFIEGACMEVGIADKRKRPREAQVLYRAAASRGDLSARQKVTAVTSSKIPPYVVASAKAALKSAPLNYWLSISGQQPDKEKLLKAMNMFWVPKNETLLAYELTETNDGVTGIIISSGGIYGSLTPGEIPFFISWEQYNSEELTQMELNGDDHFYIGQHPFYRCGNYANGTMAELLIRIKKNSQKGEV